MDEIRPDDPKDLTKEDSHDLLGYLMLLKVKRDVRIKFGAAVADINRGTTKKVIDELRYVNLGGHNTIANH